MRILALETSAKACSAAVSEDGRIVASAFQCTGLTHSRTLMPMVEDMLRNADLSLADCDAIAVAHGPGSFTGIRIGIAAAKGLAFAADKPMAGISTLEAMAMNCIATPGMIVCAMDARRQQVYNALFTTDGHTLTRCSPDRPIALSELAEEIKQYPQQNITVVGDGAHLCCRYLTDCGISCNIAPPHLLQQNAATVALAAETAAAEGRLCSAQELEAVYLRAAQADKLKSQKV